MNRLVLSGALAASFFAPASVAQVSDEAVRQAQEETFNGRRASLVYAVQGNGSWALVSIFAQPFTARLTAGSTEPRRWVARRQTGEDQTFSGNLMWADSISCPQLEGVLWSLHQAEIPSFEVPGMTAPKPAEGVEPTPVSTHGPVFTIWGQGNQPSGALAWMRVQPFGGELADWGSSAERHLANCWTVETPTP